MSTTISALTSRLCMVTSVIGTLGLLIAGIREGENIGFNARMSYALGLGYFVAALIAAILASSGSKFGRAMVTVFSGFMILYCLAYVGMVGSHYGLFWLCAIWALLTISLICSITIWIENTV